MAEIISGIVATTYATALFEMTTDEKSAKGTLDNIFDINLLLKDNPKLLTILSSVVITKEEKHSILEELFLNLVDTHLYNFLLILADKNRFDEFGGIVEQFTQMYNSNYNILKVKVTTAIPLSATLFDKLKNRLCEVTGKNIELSPAVDGSILGGVLLTLDNSEIDSTVKSKLDAIGSALKNAIV